jgi:serine/threonine-protein kinase OSR1/STK39
MDLDSLPLRSLALLQRETQLMSLSKHPNVIRVRGTWMDGHKLYIAMRLMNKGRYRTLYVPHFLPSLIVYSAADVMKYGWPGGMEEEVVRCVLKQSLEGLK